jgi:hypothetical protein
MLNNKEMWFVEFERLCAKRDEAGFDISDEELAEIAMDSVASRLADAADRIVDEERDNRLTGGK